MIKRAGFTLIEILIAITILSILIALGLMSYSRAIARSKATGCEVNLKVLKNSLDNYASEYDVFPSSLAQLEPKHINKAYAEVIIAKEDLLTKLGYFIIRIKEGNRVYAQSSLWKELGLEEKDFTCPADKTPPPEGISYGLNEYLAGMKCEEYLTQEGGLIVLGDCDQPTFGSISDIRGKRHVEELIFRERFGYYIRKDNEIGKVYSGAGTSGGLEGPTGQQQAPIVIINNTPSFIIPDITPPSEQATEEPSAEEGEPSEPAVETDQEEALVRTGKSTDKGMGMGKGKGKGKGMGMGKGME